MRFNHRDHSVCENALKIKGKRRITERTNGWTNEWTNEQTRRRMVLKVLWLRCNSSYCWMFVKNANDVERKGKKREMFSGGEKGQQLKWNPYTNHTYHDKFHCIFFFFSKHIHCCVIYYCFRSQNSQLATAQNIGTPIFKGEVPSLPFFIKHNNNFYYYLT